MAARARSGSLHSAGFSASAFSSSRRLSEASQSKAPPQQFHGLLDLTDPDLDFSAHGILVKA